MVSMSNTPVIYSTTIQLDICALKEGQKDWKSENEPWREKMYISFLMLFVTHIFKHLFTLTF